MRLLVAWFALIPASVALAQPVPAPATPASSDESARRHFLQGNALHGEGNYAAALAEFQASYRDRPVPAVLFNLAQTHKALFQYVEAVESMERYLRDAGDKAPPAKRQEAEALLAEWRALLGQVVVAADVPDASVSVDGKVVSHAGGASVRVGPGSHQVEVSAPGYETERRTVTVAAQSSERVEVRMRSVPTSGRIRVESDPPLAMVWIDGASRGPAPFDGDLPAGGHRIELRAEGYETHRDAFALTVGEKRSLQVTLARSRAPERSWYRKWYVWTGILGGAAVVGGGVALGVVLGQPAPEPYSGTFMPGVIAVGR